MRICCKKMHWSLRPIQSVIYLQGYIEGRLVVMETAAHLEYWLQWPSLVCALQVLASIMAAMVLLFKLEGGRGCRAEHRRRGAYVRDQGLWRPCWKAIHPAGLLAYRAIVFLFMLGLLIINLVMDGVFIFYFYTQWTFTLVIIYFGLAALISAKGCSQLSKNDSGRQEDERANFLKVDAEKGTYIEERTRENFEGGVVKLQSRQQGEENKEKAGFWGYTMQVLFQVSAGAVLLTDSVFWLIIVPFLSTKRFSLNLLMASMHSVNVILLLIDTALNSMPFPWFRGAYFVLWTAAYVIFQWILHACGFTWWPYPFLELSTPWAPLWYFALALVHIPCYAIFYLLVKLKRDFFPRWFPQAYLSFR